MILLEKCYRWTSDPLSHTWWKIKSIAVKMAILQPSFNYFLNYQAKAQ